MNDKHQEPLNDWEQVLHRELNELPDLQAPSSLIPKVMEKLQREAVLPWYRQSLWQWPSALRAAALILMIAIVGTLVGAIPITWHWVIAPALANVQASVAEWWEPFGSSLSVLFGVGATFWQEHLQQLLLGVALLFVAIYFTFIAAGTAVYRLAWRRTL